jgi:hypothetical protein
MCERVRLVEEAVRLAVEGVEGALLEYKKEQLEALLDLKRLGARVRAGPCSGCSSSLLGEVLLTAQVKALFLHLEDDLQNKLRERVEERSSMGRGSRCCSPPRGCLSSLLFSSCGR